MFITSDSTIAAFAQVNRQAYVARIGEFLKSRYPSARALQDGALRRAIDTQVSKAIGYGLITEVDAAKFVLTAWLCGADFDIKYRDVQELLARDMDPSEKASLLEFWSLDTLQEAGRLKLSQ